jgi:hypothetical protein
VRVGVFLELFSYYILQIICSSPEKFQAFKKKQIRTGNNLKFKSSLVLVVVLVVIIIGIVLLIGIVYKGIYILLHYFFY